MRGVVRTTRLDAFHAGTSHCSAKARADCAAGGNGAGACAASVDGRALSGVSKSTIRPSDRCNGLAFRPRHQVVAHTWYLYSSDDRGDGPSDDNLDVLLCVFSFVP